MGNGLSTDQGSFTPHGLRDVEKIGTEQRQHDWSNPEDDNMLAGAPNNEEINSLSTFNRKDGLAPTSHKNHRNYTGKISFSRNPAPAAPAPNIGLLCMKKESTCCDMKTGILESNANDRPNYDMT